MAETGRVLSHALLILSPSELVASPEYQGMSQPPGFVKLAGTSPQACQGDSLTLSEAPEAPLQSDGLSYTNLESLGPKVINVALIRSYSPPASTPRTRLHKAEVPSCSQPPQGSRSRRRLEDSFPCHSCDRICKNKAGLKSHCRAKHITQERPVSQPNPDNPIGDLIQGVTEGLDSTPPSPVLGSQSPRGDGMPSQSQHPVCRETAASYPPPDLPDPLPP